MKTILHKFACGSLLLCVQACSASGGISKPAAVDAPTLAAQAIRVDGQLAGAWRIDDRTGANLLVLTRKTGPSPAAPHSGRIEKIDLAAVYYQQIRPGQWQQEWIIRDGVDCPGLDSAAGFFDNKLTFTDLNNDGHAEVTVPYHLFCGGGIDPRVVKVILRDGPKKFAIRGESLVRYPGQKPFGGEHQHDRALLAPKAAAYKTHLDAVWRAVSADPRN